jgi:hypothetical protein
MKLIFLLFLIFLLTNCSKPKTVLICGDHVCVNKTEAEQYFEENLTIEVQIVDKKEKKKIDLIELNLKNDQKGKKKISISSKNTTDEELKALSNKEIIKIKEKIKNKKKEKKIVKKTFKKKEKIKKQVQNKKNKKKNMVVLKNDNSVQKNVIKEDKDFIDICTILDKCSIDEISKYILEQGRKKSYPKLTTRQ